jgi:2-polyprenyl-6-methoxyphenol hydroxylase-like FAD-dependent oxidoreductase
VHRRRHGRGWSLRANRLKRSLDVGVIGGGTAGSAAAVFLARAGHRVTLYERVPEPRAVGAGITIQPTGLHVLCRLGLYPYVVSRGAQIDRLLCESKATTRDKPRRALVDLSYASVADDLFGIGLHRGVLFEALLAAVAREKNITVRNGLEIVDLARVGRAGVVGAHGTSARQRDSWFVDVHGGRHGPHELVVVADGARSQLRDDTGTSKSVSPYPWGALWFVGKEMRDPESAHAHTLHQVVDGNQRFLGMLPTGRGPGLKVGPRLVSLFWSIRCDRIDAWRERGLGPWKEELAELAPESRAVLDQIDGIDQVLFASYHDVVMHRWSTRNVVYLGDAAHATSPQLGQGCNLALWDAMVLADVLDPSGPEENDNDLARALDRYSRLRVDHLAFYQFSTRMLTPFFQGDEAWLGMLRDLAMPLMARFPITNRLMTLTMFGVVDGFGGRMLQLKLPRREEQPT